MATEEKKETSKLDSLKEGDQSQKQFNDAVKKRNDAAVKTINDTTQDSYNTQKKDLQTAYTKNKTAQQTATKEGQKAFDRAKKETNFQATRNRRELDEFADVRDLNYQRGSQQSLQLNRARQTALGGIAGAQASALEESARRMAMLKTTAQNQITQALKDRNYKRAAAVYDNYNRQNEWLDQTAATLLGYGISTGYNKLYGSQGESMRKSWIATNPDYAYTTGRINAKEYKKATGKDPNDKKPEGGGYNPYDPTNPLYYNNGRPVYDNSKSKTTTPTPTGGRRKQ